MQKRVNYLNNKDLLKEIHKSKNTFCTFTQPEHHQYDVILDDIDKINVRTTAEGKRAQAKRLSQIAHEAAMEAQGKKLPAKEFEIDYKKVAKTDVIFRIMTFDHIPEDLTRKNPPKKHQKKTMKEWGHSREAPMRR